MRKGKDGTTCNESALIEKLRVELSEANGWLKHYSRTDAEMWTELKEMLKSAKEEIKRMQTLVDVAIAIEKPRHAAWCDCGTCLFYRDKLKKAVREYLRSKTKSPRQSRRKPGHL